jgi:hypothetical protein
MFKKECKERRRRKKISRKFLNIKKNVEDEK